MSARPSTGLSPARPTTRQIGYNCGPPVTYTVRRRLRKRVPYQTCPHRSQPSRVGNGGVGFARIRLLRRLTRRKSRQKTRGFVGGSVTSTARARSTRSTEGRAITSPRKHSAQNPTSRRAKPKDRVKGLQVVIVVIHVRDRAGCPTGHRHAGHHSDANGAQATTQ